MSLVINTNSLTSFTQSQVYKTESAIQSSVQRLSSGLRIQSPGDDAAGYAIASKMSTIINGLAMGVRNTNDGISYSQTATAALSSLSDNLMRMRELASQSANGSYSESDRSLLAQEYNQLMTQNNVIQTTTNFNGANIFTNKETSIQVGYRNNFQDRVNLTSMSLVNTQAINQTKITGLATSTAASDIGAAITAAANITDGGGNQIATYDSVLSATLNAINSSNKILNNQKIELSAIATNLRATEIAINAGVNNYAKDLNKLMGTTVSINSLTPTSPINSSITAATQSTLAIYTYQPANVGQVIFRANSTATVALAKDVLLGIPNSPLLPAGPGKTNITDAITSLFTQYQNTGDKAGFVSSASALLSGPYTILPLLNFSDGLTAAARTVVQADNWYLNTMPTVMNDGANTTNAQLTTAINASINASTLVGSSKSALTNTITNLFSQANFSSTPYATFKNQLQNLFVNGFVAVQGMAVSLSTAGVNALNANPISSPLDILTNTVNTAPNTYTQVKNNVLSQSSALYNAGLLSDAQQTNISNAVNTLFTQSQTANTTVPQFKNDLNALFSTGSVGPFSTSTSYQTIGSTVTQLLNAPPGTLAQLSSTDAMNKLDLALAELDQLSAVQGAIQNRFSAIIENLQSFSLSQIQSKSRIEDVDYAKEVTQLTTNQIRQSAGVAMLTQANSNFKSVISLLQSASQGDTIAQNTLLPSLQTNLVAQPNP